MKIFFYLFYLALSSISISIKFNNRLISKIFIFIFAIIWSLVIRLRKPNEDIQYYEYMMTRDDIFTPILANINEPILYALQWFMFSILNNTLYVWLISDAIAIYFLYIVIVNSKSLISKTNFEIKRFYPSIFFMILISWPFYIGFTVTYRQFFATLLFLYSLVNLKSTPKISIVTFVLSVFVHNSVAFFAPIIGFMLRKNFFNLLSILFILISPALLFYGASTRESREVGVVLASLYPFAIILICSLILIISIGQKIRLNRDIQVIMLYIPYISLLAWLLLGNGQAERFGLLSLSILIPIISILIVTKFRYKYFLMFFFISFLIFPMLTFYSGMLIS